MKMPRPQKRKKAVKSGTPNKMRAPRLTNIERCRLRRLQQKELERRRQNSNLDGGSGAPSTSSECVQRLEQPSTSSSCRMDLESGPIDVESNDDSIDMQDDNTETRTDGNIGPSMARSDLSLDLTNKYAACDRHFVKMFFDNEFGLGCDVCNRLWFKKDLKLVKVKHCNILRSEFPDQVVEAMVACVNCRRCLDTNKIPSMSVSNGFKYPDRPKTLPVLSPVEERLISPRLPFMQIRRLRHEGSYGIIGQVINVPVDVNNMVKQLPRQLDDDYAINVNIKRKLMHKSSYLSGYVRKSNVMQWLQYLVKQPLYRMYGITIDGTLLDNICVDRIDDDGDCVEEAPVLDSDCIVARQHTLLWNEENCLDIAPGQHSMPLNIVYDTHAEELSFPNIYLGIDRRYKDGVRVTPYMMATSEIRRKDRRGVTPQHILYMAMKILRMRVVEGMFHTFKTSSTVNVTRAMLNDKEFIRDCMEKNLSFLKSIPNSMQYWQDRKRDLFAMMRQLGKPTVFLTLSANEIRWPGLLSVLHRLSDSYKDVQNVEALSRSMRCHLVNEDPVTCCIVFNKLVDILMSMLCSKTKANPFGDRYRVVDYFKRIEFQHRGSPHAHILLWLNNDPKESISEDMPRTIELMNTLASVSRGDLPAEMYSNQTHQHTFTCTKRGESTCRFGIPYWPMRKTMVLLPLAKGDPRKATMQKSAERLKTILEQKVYDSVEEFLVDNHLTERKYLDTIRASLRRPTMLFKRNMSEIYTNTFNPWLARVLGSNSDLQFILDEYSCATYVVEYVNKANRGISHLQRELIKLQEENPELDFTELVRKIGVKVLNSVEMSAQEAAWYLLRQSMSHCSRQVVYIPTVWPQERQRSRKLKRQMDLENLADDSTDVWTKTKIERYEERDESLKDLCLADFIAWYSGKKSVQQQPDECDDPNADQNDEVRFINKKRSVPCVIRYRQYDISDVVNYKREMVTLYYPFRNETVDILDRNRFVEIYDTNESAILTKRREYESNINIEEVMREIQELYIHNDIDENATNEEQKNRDNFVSSVLNDGNQENNDDIDAAQASSVGISAVRKRSNVLSKEDYCKLLRSTNKRQREFILEIIHRIHTFGSPPIQVYLTGPAGSGKTYVLRVAMETYNRYTQQHTTRRDAYIACASTGKAAVNLQGTTVHSAFRISLMRTSTSLPHEALQCFRTAFVGVKCVIVDEISMIGSDVFNKINSRLNEITGVYDQPFGGMDIILTGDFRQLPPVNATPVYKSPRNNLGGCVLWQSVDFYPLTQVMRQSDLLFSKILTKIGDGKRLDSEEMAAIESRFRTVEWCREHEPNAIRLFHRNHDVDAYNRLAISDRICSSASDLITGYNNSTQLGTARVKLHKLSVMETGGLPYLLNLQSGMPYMITTNIDVDDGIVNGAIGILEYIEEVTHETAVQLVQQRDESTQINPYIRLWLHFPQAHIGKMARLKAAPRVICSNGLIDRTWTPICMRSANIKLGGSISCKRMQFPIVPACAITIHKSQGGTFDTVVYDYSKSQQIQLVYVAMSRVTSIEGLYITNSRNDFKFYHGLGCDSSTVREMRNEYLRLESHPLNTLTKRVELFMNCSDSLIEDDTIVIFFVGMNAQSLVAHKLDIETDPVLTRADFLMVSETWITNDESVQLENYNLISYEHEAMDNNPTEQQQQQQQKRKAGGVAIYQRRSNKLCAMPFNIPNNITQRLGVYVEPGTGDIALAQITVNNSFRFIAASLYIHPNAETKYIKLLLFRSLCRFGRSISKVIEEIEPDITTPIFLTGDFNVDPNDPRNDWLVPYMQQEYDLQLVQTSPTTLGNTTIDLTFVRQLSPTIMPYVSYFSYHRPIVHRLAICTNDFDE